MTEIQYLSHADQMDALRRDFLALWNDVILPGMPRGMTEKELAGRMDTAWAIYKQGKSKGKT
jgi:hypothetical protein